MKKIYDIWFSSLDIKNKTKLELLDKYTTEEIGNLKFSDFLENEIEESEIIKILKGKNLDYEKRTFEYMLNKDIKLISVRDKLYPEKLHNIDNKPAFLYIRGNENILDDDAVRNCWL